VEVLDEMEKLSDQAPGSPAGAGHGETAPEESASDNKFAPAEAEIREEAEWADDDYLAEQQTRRADQEDDEDVGNAKPLEELSEEEAAAATEAPRGDDLPKNWYILKVQSNREDSIADALKRRVKVAGMDSFFDEIIVPVEMVTEFKAGKKRIVRRKLYPGYIVVHMAITDETWFLVRDTPGIGDFTGSAGRPTPMLSTEVSRIVKKDDEKTGEEPKLQIGVKLGDRVKIREGTFENFEGDVEKIDEANGRVTVMIHIFGRPVPTEMEHWQIEAI
jgi:transcriptional antiterminator NusG